MNFEKIQPEVICLKDIYKLFLSCRKKIFVISIFVAFVPLLTVLFFLPLRWEVKATFNEGSFKEQSNFFKDFIEIHTPTIKGSGASSIMLSKRILNPVIENLGLQVKKKESFFKNLCDNILKPKKETFFFSDVSFSAKKPKAFLVSFLSRDKFIVSDKKNKVESSVGNFFTISQAQLKITKVPKKIKLNKPYSFTIFPLEMISCDLEKRIQICPKKENKNILVLSLKWSNPTLGADILNCVMNEYQNYLIKENDILANEEFLYLQKKQKEVSEKLALNLDEYAFYLSQNISKKGFMTLDWEMNSLLTPHNQYLSKLFDVDLELKRLQNVGSLPCILDDSFSGNKLQKIFLDVSTLKSEKDILSLSCLKNNKCSQNFSEVDQKIKKIDLEIQNLQKGDLDEILNGSYEDLKTLGLKKNEYLKQRDEITPEDNWIKKRNIDLEGLKQEKAKTTKLIDEINSDEKVQNAFYANWKDVCIDEEEKKQDMLQYLKTHLHLLDLKENMLKESFFSYESPEGLDLESAKDLYLKYILEKDKINLSINEILHLKEKLPRKNFEVSSLSLCLSDPVSLGIIAKAGQLILDIEDQKNRTEKDILRLKDELELQKKFLQFHLDEMVELKNINLSLIENKLSKLKKIIFFDLNQKISLLNAEAKNFVDSRIKNLEEEKKLLLERTHALQDSMVDLPLRWKAEKLLQIKTEMGLNIMKSTTDLLESKTIQHHLEQLQSKPLDIATVPTFVKKPKIIFLFVLFFCISYFLIFVFYFLKSAVIGFPVSLDSLKALNYHVCGHISKKLKNLESINFFDLETLRNISSFLDQPKNVAVIINNASLNYSSALAKLLSKKGKRVLLINCENKNDGCGFLGLIEKKIEKLPVVQKDGYDLLEAGGDNSFLTEIIGSKDFAKMVEELSEKYAEVIIYSSARPTYSEAKIFLKFADKIIITLKDETMEELRPYFVWNNENDCRYLSFIAIS